jgi:hypothetical protein
MSPQRAFIVVPFERIGRRLGPRQVFNVEEGRRRAFSRKIWHSGSRAWPLSCGLMKRVR